MAQSAQPLNVNTLHNVQTVEELIQLTVESDVEIIANSHETEDFTYALNTLNATTSVLNRGPCLCAMQKYGELLCWFIRRETVVQIPTQTF